MNFKTTELETRSNGVNNLRNFNDEGIGLMGWRFSKRITLFPGFTLNLGKSGVSFSFGPKGFKTSVGKKGTFLNIGIPGTGLSNRTRLDSPKRGKTRGK